MRWAATRPENRRFFLQPADAIVPVVPPDVGHVQYPLATKNYHHEIELVVAIGAPAFGSRRNAPTP